MSLLIVTGTGTAVGKTVTTAALAALARARGERVAVVKPAQTGEPPGAPGDLATVAALTGVTDLHEFARYPDPLSPEAAARASGQPPLDLRRAADRIAALAEDRDLVLVEGAGGLLVRYDPAGSTIADLATMLDAPVVVVTAGEPPAVAEDGYPPDVFPPSGGDDNAPEPSLNDDRACDHAANPSALGELPEGAACDRVVVDPGGLLGLDDE